MNNYNVTNYINEKDQLNTFIHIGETEIGSENIIYWLSEDQIKLHFSKLFYISEVTSIKQDLYVTAINNLLKKINFLELYQEYSNGNITDVEFEERLDQEPNRYSIQMTKTVSDFEKNLIVQIISQIGSDVKDFSLSDIAELFSINNKSIMNTFMIG